MVRVDRETGAVAIERYIAGYDIGRAINPALVKGQIVGGFTQGLGGALFEEFQYSERGDPLSASFADYIMPGVHETPRIEVILTEESPSPLNPLGIKGAGESGITPVGAVIASAVEAAIGMPGAITALPITPQRLKRILDGGGDMIDREPFTRHGRARPGHPRLCTARDVMPGDKPGHDGS